MTSFPNCLKRRKDKLMSMLEEDLTVADDSDFDDLFPTPDTSSPSDLDEVVTVVGEDEEDDSEPVVIKTPKRRGRPPKTADVEEKPKKKPGRKKKEEESPKEEEEPVAAVKKKRGRPSLKKDDEPEVLENKPRAKRLNVDDIAPEILERIFEEYSQRPSAEFAKDLGLTEHHLEKAVDRMRELFETSIATGDLTQDDYEEIIVPKLTAYIEPKDEFETFVQKTVKNINKKK